MPPLPSPVVLVLLPLPPCRRPLAPYPPCEQSLAAVGIGCRWCRPSLGVFEHLFIPRCWRRCHSTHSPPNKQLLVRLGVGGVASFVVLLPRWCCPSSSLPFHPRSTPRAVARGAGGGWCVVRHVVLVLGLSVVVPVVPIGGGGVTWPVAPEPPCEQVLAAMGGGCWCSPSLVSLAPRHGTHPQTTLRAAACRRGGGRCVVPGCWGPRCRCRGR